MIGKSFILAGILFVIGLFGIIVNRKNLITILISIEVIFLAANINFVAAGSYYGVSGHVLAIFTLAVAAAEAAIGLSILIVYFRNAKNVEVDDMNRLRG